MNKLEILGKENLSFVSVIMMFESQEINHYFVIINFKLENKTFEYMHPHLSSQIMPKMFVSERGNDNFLNLISENFSQDRILTASFIDFLTALRVDKIGINHSVNISSTEFNLMKGPFLLCSSSLANFSFNGSQSTGCQSIELQNSQFSSDKLPVLMYSSNISFFMDSSLDNSDQFTQGKASILFLNDSSKGTVIQPIYNSPLALNLSKVSSFFFNPCLITSGQFTSGLLSNLAFNSSGIEKVVLIIFSNFNTSNNCLNICKCISLFKYFDENEENVFNESFTRSNIIMGEQMIMK